MVHLLVPFASPLAQAGRQALSALVLPNLSALLALPTVVFSLYGMNFVNMPELKWPWAYPALMLATGAAVEPG